MKTILSAGELRVARIIFLSLAVTLGVLELDVILGSLYRPQPRDALWAGIYGGLITPLLLLSVRAGNERRRVLRDAAMVGTANVVPFPRVPEENTEFNVH